MSDVNGAELIADYLVRARVPYVVTLCGHGNLGMLAALACRVTVVQYRIMLDYSLRSDPMMAQVTMKNIVLLTAILILTYALYVPKTWQRAALVVGPLALLPFATLLFLDLQYPEAFIWLEQGWKRNPNTPRGLLFVFDLLILIMLAVGSTFGARMMSRLRRKAWSLISSACGERASRRRASP